MKGTLTIVGNNIERTDLSIQLPSSALISMTSSLVPPYPLNQMNKSAEIISRLYLATKRSLVSVSTDNSSFLALLELSKKLLDEYEQIDRLSTWFPHVPAGFYVDCFLQSGQLVVRVSNSHPGQCLDITATVPSFQAVYISLLNMILTSRIFDNVNSIL